jgi:hypothetical protein
MRVTDQYKRARSKKLRASARRRLRPAAAERDSIGCQIKNAGRAGDRMADLIGFGHDGVLEALSNGFHLV